MKYQLLVDQLADQIARGQLRPGERLPNQREMAQQFGVTITTITRAVAEATRRGLVVARPGSGTFVAAGPAEAVRPAPGDGIDLRPNTVPIPPGIRAALSRAMAALAREDRPEQLFSAEPVAGSGRHREAAAAWLALRGLPCGAETLLLSHGAQHGLAACLSALARPGYALLCEAHVYAGLHRLAAEAGLRLHPVAMDTEGVEPAALAAAMAETGARLLLCSPAAQNPTTATMGPARRQAVLAACERAGALVIEDDVCGFAAGDPVPPLAAMAPERVIYVTGLSKSVAPAFRLGIIRPPASVRAAIRDALGVQHWVAPAFHAEVLARLVEDGAASTCLREHRQEMTRRMATALAALGPGRLGRPSLPSYHLWLPIPAPWRSDDFLRGLEERGLRALGAGHFAAAGLRPAPHLRACLGDIDLPTIERAFAAIGHLMMERPWSTEALV
ncbi:PLP-dependent aminotransferase family protein [Roseomonas chloroacetimidivorans]|uniref:aminotransferase-like domain-containing protein n=1 Tax=Roseomonas chloroacetimidivorans TaxID=1766656 RepID=UPI003C77969A